MSNRLLSLDALRGYTIAVMVIVNDPGSRVMGAVLKQSNNSYLSELWCNKERLCKTYGDFLRILQRCVINDGIIHLENSVDNTEISRI
jgi:hypothetical protein